MKQLLKLNIVGLAMLGALSACTPSASNMTKLLEKNPEILANAIEKNPDIIMTAIQKAAQGAQAKQQEKAMAAEEAKMEEEIKNPLKPEIPADRPMMGPATAPITIVEYTDFQCPYCARGYDTMEQVRKQYGDKVRVLVKNLPLPMHPMAIPASKRFEAILLQSPEKGFAFYHEVFKNQEKLNAEEEKFLDATAKKVGANMAQMKKDMDGAKVKAIIDADMAEAKKYEFSGTPGFIVDGVSIRGAYPFETFQKLIDKKLASAK